jgi:tetratricopeptide (TPR) repeat protein
MSTEDLTAIAEAAREAFAKQDYATAATEYRRVLDQRPQDPEALEGWALASCVTGQAKPAVAAFEQLSYLEPREARHFVNWGAACNLSGDYATAMDVLRKAIQRERKSVDGYYNLGMAEWKAGKVPQAVQAFKQVLALAPKLPEPYFQLGQLYLEQKNFVLAATNFKKALELKPNWEQAQTGLGQIETQQAEAKAQTSPFGRLVKTQAQTNKAVQTFTRELSDAERWEDRQEVHQISSEMQALSQQVLEFLQKQYEPVILGVQRIVADGDLQSAAFMKAVTALEEVCFRWSELRQQHKRKAIELRAHEELINTPDLN